MHCLLAVRSGTCGSLWIEVYTRIIMFSQAMPNGTALPRSRDLGYIVGAVSTVKLFDAAHSP